jgi:hypothetical protein
MEVVGEVPRAVVVQLKTPDHLRGRVSAINALFASGGPQLGQLNSGALAAAFGPVPATAIGAAGSLISVGVFAVLPPIRRAMREFRL